MKKYVRLILVITLFLSVYEVESIAQAKVLWTRKNATDWFNKREWLLESNAENAVKYDGFGRILEQSASDTSSAKVTYLDLRELKPSASIDKVEFAKQYHVNKDWWNTGFSFLQTTDLTNIKPGRYAIDGDNVYAIVTEGLARKEDTARWESHRNYTDIHYVIKGQEKIGVAPLSEAKIVNRYDASRDITFYKAKGKDYKADTTNFFILFPQDVYRPNILIDKNEMVKKIVIKIKRGNL